MHRTTIFAVAFLGIGLAFSSQGQPPSSTDSPASFHLIYRHDAQGLALSGSLDDLRRAVRAGLEIRVGWAFRHPEQTHVSVEHVADASFLTILSGEHVLAQIEPIAAQRPDFDAGRIHFRDGQHWRMIASTKGEMISQVTKRDGTAEDERVRPQGYSWFVRGTALASSEPLWDVERPAEQPVKATDRQFKAVMQELASAWNDGDARRAASCFTEDAVYSEPPAKQLYRGREALFEFFGGEAGREGQMTMVWHHLAFDEDAQIGFGEFSFTYGSAAHGVVVVRLQGGKIKNWREYWYGSELSWQEFTRDNPF